MTTDAAGSEDELKAATIGMNTARIPSKTPARSGSAAAGDLGAIILARHGEPALSRKVRLNAREYAAWWARYEQAGLRDGQSAPEDLRTTARAAGAVLCSTRPRSVESARALGGGPPAEIDPDLIEAPLPPPHWPDWLKLKPRSWGVVSRFLWWCFDHHDGQESRAAAQIRAEAVTDRLCQRALGGRDVLVIAHGFFNAMIGRCLKQRGWSLAQDQGFSYWSARRFVRRD